MPESLSPNAVRVLGALMEKSMSTPEYYPLTLNALRTACNQKSNRNPVVSFSESDVISALDELQKTRLVGHASGVGSRSVKYRHAAAEAMELTPAGCAVMACLSLRGAQTIGEIRARTGRLFDFESLEDVGQVLDSLATRDEPLVRELGRQPGQKETRYVHQLSGTDTNGAFSGENMGTLAADIEESIPASSGSPASSEAHSLRDELTELRAEVVRLRQDFEAFKDQFQ